MNQHSVTSYNWTQGVKTDDTQVILRLIRVPSVWAWLSNIFSVQPWNSTSEEALIIRHKNVNCWNYRTSSNDNPLFNKIHFQHNFCVLLCVISFFGQITEPLRLPGMKLYTQFWKINGREIWFVQDAAAQHFSTAAADHWNLAFQDHQSRLELFTRVAASFTTPSYIWDDIQHAHTRSTAVVVALC